MRANLWNLVLLLLQTFHKYSEWNKNAPLQINCTAKLAILFFRVLCASPFYWLKRAFAHRMILINLNEPDAAHLLYRNRSAALQVHGPAIAAAKFISRAHKPSDTRRTNLPPIDTSSCSVSWAKIENWLHKKVQMSDPMIKWAEKSRVANLVVNWKMSHSATRTG